MRAFLCWTAMLLCSVTVAGGQAANPITPAMSETARQLIASAQRENAAYDIVRSLTTEVGPRLAGTEAEARARHWAVAKLKALGLANVRVEPFEVPVWVRGDERAEIVVPFAQPLTITTLGGSASTGPQGVEAQVISFATLAALEASPAENVQGKIVFINEVMARSRDGSGYGAAVQKRRETAYTAQRLGAVAALIRSVGTSSHRFAHTGQMQRVGTSTGIGVPTAALASSDADQLDRILAYGKPVTVKLVITPRQLPPAISGNVVGEIIGSEAPGEIVLVGAHLDSWDTGTGAVDDGAGVAVVLAAAKVLMETLEQSPRRTVRVVLFGAEEVGVVGAQAYAAQHAATLSNHVIAAESDFGAGDIWRFDTRVSEESLPVATAIAAVLKPLGIAPGNNDARGGPDLTFLREAGVPIASLLQDGTDYFDLHHTADDTLDKITPQALDQNVAAYAAFMYLAAQLPEDFR